MSSEVTTIQVEKRVKEILAKFGKKGETYNTIIKRILKSHQYVVFMEEQYEILDKEENWVSLDEL
jgi:hypothetical protein